MSVPVDADHPITKQIPWQGKEAHDARCMDPLSRLLSSERLIRSYIQNAVRRVVCMLPGVDDCRRIEHKADGVNFTRCGRDEDRG